MELLVDKATHWLSSQCETVKIETESAHCHECLAEGNWIH